MDDKIEHARLLARFKLQVRRQLDQSVDLDRLVQDAEYARTRLAEIEDLADDEDLLVMLLTLREQLLPRAVATAPMPATTPSAAAKPVESRNYRFGARGG
ncbi:hypothetical protein GCM10025771_03770 [Niveibacterium umoris]|uniref:Uncharacterized protein n=1 Tax=Niveibacterium umoris TaxID=1193620 RepID=A0A840BRK3_9RHOO|nr:hypothetical protein [Niveibacterium umoris]MBB4014079.1 hypothetical protein [Niveibacterium umoris]